MVGELVSGDAVGTLVVGALGLAIGEFDGLALGGGLGDALGEVVGSFVGGLLGALVGFLDGAIVGNEVVGLVGGAPPPFKEYSTPPTHPNEPEDIDPNSELSKETTVGLRSNKFSSAARGVLLSPSTAKRPVAVM